MGGSKQKDGSTKAIQNKTVLYWAVIEHFHRPTALYQVDIELPCLFAASKINQPKCHVG